jgi:asparagine synthase (glutamine-hydrolysing)
MVGPLRELFEHLLGVTRGSGLVDPAGVDALWQAFLREPAGSTWSRVWLLGVLGAWLGRRAAGPAGGERWTS